jgi:hypothetical protein
MYLIRHLFQSYRSFQKNLMYHLTLMYLIDQSHQKRHLFQSYLKYQKSHLNLKFHYFPHHQSYPMYLLFPKNQKYH